MSLTSIYELERKYLVFQCLVTVRLESRFIFLSQRLNPSFKKMRNYRVFYLQLRLLRYASKF